ncbi:MAG: phosphate/phosphite/phosphonate ABC transporter substrate-binding protein [Myxococcales bacterium]|nr:phosphate/phosphite/phosphonate ABC transporter substrate-binding protein [Myxococcales bacterium]
MAAACGLAAACTTTERVETRAGETVASGLLPAPDPPDVAGKPLRLLFIPFAASRETERASAANLESYVEARTGLVVEPILTENYQEAARRFVDGEADAAFLAPLLYVEVAERFARDPALRDVRLRLLLAAVSGGSPSYVGYVVAPADGPLRELRDAAGLPFGLIEDSTSGYLYPIDLVESRGLDPAEFFREARIYRTHGEVLADLLRPPGERRLAAGALYHNIVDTLPADARNRLRLLAKTARIPRDAVAARIPLVGGREDPERLRAAAALQHALLAAGDDPAMAASLREEIGYDGWIVGDDRRYDAIRRVRQRFGHYRFGAPGATEGEAEGGGFAGAATEAPGER